MLSKPLAFTLVVGCVAAAGVGGFLATRSLGAGSEPISTLAIPVVPAETEGVLESEGIVEAEPGEAAPVDAVEAPAAVTATISRAPEPPARRTAPAPRPRPAPAAEPARAAPARERGVADVAPARPVAEAELPAGSRVEAGYAPMPVAPEPRPAPVVPEKVFTNLVVEADSVIGLQIENTLTSEFAHVEDEVEARVTRDVRVGDEVAIPAGARMQGSVTLVEQGGKIKERARLGVRFHTLVLADGTRVPIRTETIYRDGESPKGESTAKIGGAAVGGAILGAIFGGAKGAAIGGSVGAAGGTAAVMAGGRNPAELKAGSTVTVRLSDPVTVTVERDQ
jgi:hypothetical protein